MIGENIRSLRKEKGMTMEVLAKAAGVTGGYISQLERNLVDPSLSTLRRISKVFGVPMASFLDEDAADAVMVVRANSSHMLGTSGASNYAYLSPIPADVGAMNMEVLRVVIAANSWDSEDDIVHNAEECTSVISGCVCVMANDIPYD